MEQLDYIRMVLGDAHRLLLSDEPLEMVTPMREELKRLKHQVKLILQQAPDRPLMVDLNRDVEELKYQLGRLRNRRAELNEPRVKRLIADLLPEYQSWLESIKAEYTTEQVQEFELRFKESLNG